MKITKETAPARTRLLLKIHDCYQSLVVLEWSPQGKVHLRSDNGLSDYWIDANDADISEILPPARYQTIDALLKELREMIDIAPDLPI